MDIDLTLALRRLAFTRVMCTKLLTVSTTEATVRAIESVVEAVRRSRRVTPERQAKTVAALEHVASVTRDHGATAVERSLAAIDEDLLRPIDPSEFSWSVFRLFHVSNRETAWTKWIAGILSPELGPELSALAWRSFCDAIVRHAAEPTPCDATDRIATLADWRAARDVPLSPGSLGSEEADEQLGRIDISVRAPSMFAIIENKLDADWHDGDGDGDGEPQAVRYRKIGLKRRIQDQRLGLVVLTKHDDFELDNRCRDYVKITYRDLARALRRNLRSALCETGDTKSVLRLWPAFLTVAAIEQDLLGLDIVSQLDTARLRSWKAIEMLNEILEHLHDEDR
jgi:PD-(D/E)XK nuclease superfamily